MFEDKFYDHTSSGWKSCGEIFQHCNDLVAPVKRQLTKYRYYLMIEAVNTVTNATACIFLITFLI